MEMLKVETILEIKLNEMKNCVSIKRYFKKCRIFIYLFNPEP